MKYVEHIKSGFLLLLVVLSITLTFSIWTFTPSYPEIQKAPAMDISIAESQRLNDVLKPYKMVFSFEDEMTGTSSSTQVDYILDVMKDWEFRELTMINNNLSVEALNDISNTPNRFTIFYPSDIPFPVFDNVWPFSNTNVKETGFDRIIVDWNFTDDGELTVYFPSSSTNLLYTAKARIGNQNIEEKILASARGFSKYMELQRNQNVSLFVPSNEVETIRYTYIFKEIPPIRFKDALFDNPNKVRRSSTGTFYEEYSDDTALMNVDLLERTFKYSYPAAESSNPGIPSELVFDSLDFVNEHEGWTDDYIFSGVDPVNQRVNYQLTLQGYPVFSEMSSTTISTIWGNNRIFSYVRPYYTLGLSLPSETDVLILPSGERAAQILEQVENLDVASVKELLLGYYLTRDDEKGLLNLEPSWFYLSNKVWTRLTPDVLGGGPYGLE